MEIEGSLPCSQQPGLGPSSEPNTVDSQPSCFLIILFYNVLRPVVCHWYELYTLIIPIYIFKIHFNSIL
jgi:hypothetical protein